jgi:Uncharacterised nucleotidyltransferase
VTPDTLGGAAVRAVAGFGLSCAPTTSVHVDEDAWPGLKSSLIADRLTGLAVAAAQDGMLLISDDQFDELMDAHRDAMLWALDLERTLVALGASFRNAGIEFVVLKGPALAHTTYPDASWRPFMDIDLLVRTRDWRRSCSLLAELGLRRRLSEPRPGFDERFGKAACHVNDKQQEIDLHRTLVLGPFGLWMDPGELFDNTSTFQLGGARLECLDDTARLVHACIHASLGMRRSPLIAFRDAAQTLELGEVDWELLADWSKRWKLGVVLQDALERTSALIGSAWPLALKGPLRSGRANSELRSMSSYTTDRRQRGGTSLSTLRAIPGIGGKAAYVAGLLFPSKAFLAARAGEHRASYLRRLTIPLRWVLKPRPRRTP